MTDENTAGGGVPEGQGQDQSGGGIFDPYLQAVPETWEQPPSGSPRDVVAKYLTDAQKGVNSRLSEAAEIQKRFGPYSDIDLSGWEPERLSNALGWVDQMSNDDEAFKAWLKEAATEAGLFEQEGETEPEQTGLTPEQVQAMIREAVEPFRESEQTRTHQEGVRALESQIDQDFSALEKEHGITLTDDQKLAIGDLGESHQGDDWIAVGFKRFQALTGEAQADFVKGNSGQPTPPIKSGGQEAPTRPTDFKGAESSAAERMRQILAS